MDLAEKSRELAAYLLQVEAAQSPISFACSFGAEDMVLLDAIAKHARKIEVFTLDSGRFPQQLSFRCSCSPSVVRSLAMNPRKATTS